METDDQLLAEFRQLWADADRIWEREDKHPAFEAYVSADYLSVFQNLQNLKGQAVSFLEWGSGLGVVTIMASRMGFDAYGIEAESNLVDYSMDLAEAYGSDAQMVHGSFIPDEFVWNPANGDEAIRTTIDAPDGYAQLDLDLCDFDLIYAYPWPTEHALYHNILREFGGPNVRLLSYDAREGIALVPFGV
ncbi:MAG: hypothetical protein P8J27_09050 [Mariniblastus sp.]|nr:hypothetical protein [Mariniblastus sp.]